MLKTKAIELLGGSTAAAANAIGISYQAVNKWPDELPPRIADRVYAVWGKKNMPETALTPASIAQPAIEIKAPELAQVAPQAAHEAAVVAQGA